MTAWPGPVPSAVPGLRGLGGRVAVVRGGFQVDDLLDGWTQMIAGFSCDG